MVDLVYRTSVTLVEMNADGSPRVVHSHRGWGTLKTASGTLLRIGERFFLLTAAHVADDLASANRIPTAFVLPGRPDLKVEQPAIQLATKGVEERYEDAAVLELDSRWIKRRELRAENFLTMDSLCPLGGPVDLRPGELVAIFGTPRSTTRHEQGSTSLSPLLYTTTALGEDSSAHVKSYRASLEPVGIGPDSSQMPVPEPEGMSGGSVWLIPAEVPHFEAGMMRVIGVQLGVYERKQLRIGPIENWISLLVNGFDDQLAAEVKTIMDAW